MQTGLRRKVYQADLAPYRRDGFKDHHRAFDGLYAFVLVDHVRTFVCL
ncbi:hypothetical protein [Pseudomonas sp. LB3P58]